MKLLFVFILSVAGYALLTRCQIMTSGAFFQKIGDEDEEGESLPADQPTLSPEFFTCGRTQSCSNVVKYKDTKEYQTVNGEEELKKIKRAVETWEKVDKKPDEWVVIQRRSSSEYTEFNRSWTDYKTGFGNETTGNWWMGLEKMHSLASPGSGAMLKITLKHRNTGDTVYYAHYSLFEIANEADGYRLNVGGYSGTAGDSLNYHNSMKFSTYDRDNDDTSVKNCALDTIGGWWYANCQMCNLNTQRAMSWFTITNTYGGISFSEMKVKIDR